LSVYRPRRIALTGNRIIEAFTELAPNYEKVIDWELRFMWGLAYRQFVDMLLQAAAVAEGSIVLDIATGTAVIPVTIGSNGHVQTHIVGLDITPSMLRHGARSIRAANTISPVSLVCASAMNIPFGDGVFDVAICGLGMHHLDVPQALSEMRRMLKVNGRLVIGTAGVPSFWLTWWGRMFVAGTMGTVFRLTHTRARADAEMEALDNIHTEQGWRELLSASGLADIEIAIVSPRHRLGASALIITARRVS
jgi:ubiquinone/menaquinone biosynthesis C-methylase UbiE